MSSSTFERKTFVFFKRRTGALCGEKLVSVLLLRIKRDRVCSFAAKTNGLIYQSLVQYLDLSASVMTN